MDGVVALVGFVAGWMLKKRKVKIYSLLLRILQIWQRLYPQNQQLTY